MKECHKCKVLKKKSEFHSNKTKKDGIQDSCKKCQNEYTRSHYKKNKKYYIDKADTNRKVSKVKIFRFLIEYCKNHPCKCGEKDYVVMDFNHKVRSSKTDNISSMIMKGVSLENIKKEIRKCETMCSNCHRRHTAKQMNWYNVLITAP
jgi:hypothetical protein